jgi:hypothetical protein
MSYFPNAVVTPVLDDAKRVNEGPPPSLRWVNVGDGLKVDGAAFAPSIDDGQNFSIYDALDAGPDCEVFARVIEIPTDGDITIYLRLDRDLGNGHFIAVGEDPDPEYPATPYYIQTGRLDGWAKTVQTTLFFATIPQFTWIRLTVLGNSFYGYYRLPGEQWAGVGGAEDSAYLTPGCLAASITTVSDFTGSFDNFGGGTLLEHLMEAPTYQAKVWLQDDEGNDYDRYVVCWYKNGEPVTAGVAEEIVDPKIEVIQASDGVDLIAEDDMTDINSTGLFRYDEAINRVVDGAVYIAKVTATIDTSSRTWYQPVGRDS